MPYGDRVGTNKIRTDPPIVSIHSNFIWSHVVRVVFVRQFVHLTTYFFIAANVNHVLAELFIADEAVVNTQEEPLLAFLLERVRGEVLVIPWLLPVTVPVGSPFLDVIVGNREEVKSVLDSTCSRRCRSPSTTDILCTVLWLPHRVVRTTRCSQLH